MPSKKLSVYLTGETIDLIHATAAPDREHSVSGRLNTICGRYSGIVFAQMPTFSIGEWCAICDANNGTLFEGEITSLLWANVADSKGIGEKWDCDKEKLVAKLRSLSTAQEVAAVEVIERFWAGVEGEDYSLRLQNAGARTIEPFPTAPIGVVVGRSGPIPRLP